MTGMLLFSLDECTRVIPYGSFDEVRHNDGREAFTIAYNGGRCLGRKVTNQVDSLEDILQFAQELIHLVEQHRTGIACRNHGIHHFDVTVHDVTIFLFVSSIAISSHLRCLDQLICNATQGRNHHNHGLFYGLNYLFYT